MKVPYSCTRKSFDRLYQEGQGLQVFRGTPYQRGHGLGGILAGLFRAAVPVLKRTAIPFLKNTAVKAGKRLLKTGVEIAGDALRGENVKQSAKKRSVENTKAFGKSVLKNVTNLVAPLPDRI